MKDLKAIFESLKFENVQTYIQSGNVIFENVNSLKISEIEELIEKEIKEKYGFDVAVVVRKSANWKNILIQNSFQHLANFNEKRMYVGLLKFIPKIEKLNQIKEIEIGEETFEIVADNIYIYCSENYHKSKLTTHFFESKLKVPVTVRNWKTMNKLNQLLQNE